MTVNQSTVKSDMATVDYGSFQPTKPHCLLSNCLSYQMKRKGGKKGSEVRLSTSFCKEVMRLDQMRTKPLCPPYGPPRAVTVMKKVLGSSRLYAYY